MMMAALNRAKIPAESPQPSRGRPGRAKKGSAPARPEVLATRTGRDFTRGGDEVIELECGITVYPARSEGGRWRAVWYEAGTRQQCEAGTEAKLAPKLEEIVERLQAGAPNMRRRGADLIAHYLDPDRLPVHDRWSRKHADTQRRLCERFAAPVIAVVTCQGIKPEHTQKIVNAAPTAGEGDRVHRMLSALVSAASVIAELFAGVHDGDTARVSARKFLMYISRARVLATQLGLDLHELEVDVSGADLSGMGINPDLLNGVVWTDQTSWPPGVASQVRAHSTEIRAGVYQVRLGNTPERDFLALS
jgi:hypothetical protein